MPDKEELQALAMSYEKDIEILKKQIKALEREKKKCPDYDIKRRLVILRDMLSETQDTAEMLKHYYDKDKRKKYVKHKYYNGSSHG